MNSWTWGVLAQGEAEAQRVSLDLGLRPALLYYGEMSVPGIGGARFVRQLIWPALAIHLRTQASVRIPAARLASAIEALACKLWLDAHGDAEERAGRIAGVRSLPGKGWTFGELGLPRGYVTNPMRRAATSALPGLGFAEGGQRLDGMVLTEQGEVFLQDALEKRVRGGPDLAGWLRLWVDGERNAPTAPARNSLLEAIGSFEPTPRERRTLRAVLLRDTEAHHRGQRRRLIEALERRGRMHTFEEDEEVDALLRSLEQADRDRIAAAWAFRRMLTEAQATLRSIAQGLRVPGAKPKLANVLRANAADAHAQLKQRSKTFLKSTEAAAPVHYDAQAAAMCWAADPLDAARDLVDRAPSLLRLEDDRLLRGPAFSERWLQGADDGSADEEVDAATAESPVTVDLPPRFSALLGLLADCKGR